jgi:subtilisin-like proprotein convertase family protein
MAGGAGEDGWSQPPLTALNGEFWCQKVMEAHPEVAKFALVPSQPTYEVTPGQMLASFDVPVAGTVTYWKIHFEFKTQCENDHHIELMSPTGRAIGLMDRGLNRCSGRFTTFTSDNEGQSGGFVDSEALGTWQLKFQDLDDNAYTGAMTKVRLELGIDVGGDTTKYIVKLNGMPKKVPNPE